LSRATCPSLAKASGYGQKNRERLASPTIFAPRTAFARPCTQSSPCPFQESIKDLSVPHDELGIARVQVTRKRTNLRQLHLFAVNDHFPNIVQFQHQASPKVRDVVAKWQDEECNESDNQQSNKGRTASRQQE
jgi:hypothetical protein